MCEQCDAYRAQIRAIPLRGTREGRRQSWEQDGVILEFMYQQHGRPKDHLEAMKPWPIGDGTCSICGQPTPYVACYGPCYRRHTNQMEERRKRVNGTKPVPYAHHRRPPSVTPPIRRSRKPNPRRVGIYFHRNREGAVIYVGKGTQLRANILKTRKPDHAREVQTILWRATPTPADALVLEAMFIRKYQPKYNIIGVTR